MPPIDPDRDRAKKLLCDLLDSLQQGAEIVISPEGAKKPHRLQFPRPCMFGGSLPLTDRPERPLPEQPPPRSVEIRPQGSSWPSAKGGPFYLNRQQGAVVDVLLEAYQEGNPEVREDVLVRAARAAGSDATRLRGVFAGNPAWGRLIIQGRIGGTYRLPPLPGDGDGEGDGETDE